MRVWRMVGVLGAAAGLLLGALPGTAGAAAPAPEGSCAPDPSTPLRQFRASWVASVVNIDWPSRTGLTAAQQQAELVGWFDDAVRQHHNAVVLQVRPTADAFWPSKVEPWSQYLTGKQGGDPGYDPLAFAVAEAHKRNLEL
ncbi:MAG TPA: family 10 glycosylhydrolase, partial [Kribbella sp.]